MRFFKKLKNIGPADLGACFLFLLALLPAMILKKKRPHIWLVCEYKEEARDNGYWFFRYLREEHPEVDAVYAIDKKASDYQRVSGLGPCVEYSSLRHWIYYLAAEVNISSQKGGKPNAAVCYFLEVYGILKNRRVFLQHGIIRNMLDTFLYKNTKMRLFICGAEPEYRFIRDNYGYPENHVVYTGLARFDNLFHEEDGSNMILISPTWRKWLYQISSDPYENHAQDTESSEYYKTWTGLLKNPALTELLQKYNYTITFFAHRNATAIFEQHPFSTDRIRIVTWKQEELQSLMKRAKLMITDYSSVATDFSYMEKPVLYYQFDGERFFKEHYGKIYSGEYDGFGSVVQTEQELLDALDIALQNSCQVSDVYKEKINQFFVYRDQNNRKRIFEAILKVIEEDKKGNS